MSIALATEQSKTTERPKTTEQRTTEQQKATPVEESKRSLRLTGIDATRGLALLGMMAVHSLYESDDAGNATLSFAVFGGRASAAFAVLAGVGIAFMTGRKRVMLKQARPTVVSMAVRAVAIGAIGLALGYTDASLGAVILPYYAVLFLLAIPLVFFPTWLIAIAGVGIAFGVPALNHVLLPRLSPATLENPTLGYLFQHPLGLLSELLVTGEYPAISWLAYICAGLIIGRLRLATVRVAWGMLGGGALLGVGAAVASTILLNHFGGLDQIWKAQPTGVLTVPETSELLTLGGDGTVPTDSWWWLAVNSPHTGTPLDILGTIGSAAGMLGLMLLLARITWPPLRIAVMALQKPLAAAGSMTLTFYTLHIMFINSDYDSYETGTSYLLQVIAVLLLGLAWRATAGRGPLESLVSAVANRARKWSGGVRRRPTIGGQLAGTGP